MLLLILLFSSSSAQFQEEVSTPASLLGPRDFNHHAYLGDYLDRNQVEPTKQGPVLFPNDAPPPPRPPLIVTSRPLIESIARSELNPTPPTVNNVNGNNNSVAEATQVSQEYRVRPDYLSGPDFSSPESRPYFRLKPALLAKVQGYKPFLVSTPDYGLYSKKEDGGRYGDYDEPLPTLPPIYKAIAEHAKQKVLKLKHTEALTEASHAPAPLQYLPKQPVYPRRYQHTDVRDYGDYDHDSNYAFSYTVKDHKTGDDFSHSQQSYGSATNGEYRVRLPDGRMQIVSYTADENGYKADVRYDDEDKTAGNSIDYNHDYGKHDYGKHDFGKYDFAKHGFGKHDYGKHDYDKHDFETHDRDKHDFEKHDHDHKHDFGKDDYGKYDYARNNYDYGKNSHDYAPNTHDYSINRVPYTPTNYDTNAYNYDLNKYANQDYVANKNNYVTKPPPVKEDLSEYSDSSKEYYNNDYSLDYDGKNDNYTPHKSKFSSFAPKGSNLGTIVVPANKQKFISSSTVKPSYEELKPLFVTKNLYGQSTPDYLKNVEINVPSTTPSSVNYDTTEHVVVIGGTKKPNLYTNVRNSPLTVTPSPFTTPSNFVTPSGYLESTISQLKNGQVPVLSGRFIDKINKYLTFT